MVLFFLIKKNVLGMFLKKMDGLHFLKGMARGLIWWSESRSQVWHRAIQQRLCLPRMCMVCHRKADGQASVATNTNQELAQQRGHGGMDDNDVVRTCVPLYYVVQARRPSGHDRSAQLGTQYHVHNNVLFFRY